MYSPSQTKTFSRCKYKWFLKKFMGIDYSTVGKRDLAACVGVAVGAAIQSYLLSGRKLTQKQLAEQALSHYKYAVADRCKDGRTVQDCEEAELYPTMLEGMIQAYLKRNPIPQNWTIEQCEAPISDEYNAYLDIVGECPRGTYIVDIKCKMKEKLGFMQNSLLKYQFDPQLHQYVREWSKKKEKKVDFYRIVYVVGSPVPGCTYQDFEVDPAFEEQRRLSDERIWAEMDSVEHALKQFAKIYGSYSKIPIESLLGLVPMASEHYDGFYKCDMWDPCLVYGGDAAASPSYIQIERKELK